jgi:hypothetical protein
MIEIINLYNKYYFQIDINTFFEYFSDFTKFEIINALRNIINDSIVIFNKYGFPSYLKEDNNIYFLVDNLSIENNYYSEYYTKNPIINIKTSFSTIVDDIYILSAPKIIRELFKMSFIEEMKELINKLPVSINEIILENCIIANEKNIQINKLQRDNILNIFRNYYRRIILEDNIIIVSSLLYNTKNILKCLDINNIDQGWKNCNLDIEEKYKTELSEELEKIKENKYKGYYGLYNKDKFCIKSPDQDDDNKDTRKKKSGQVCGKGVWKKPGMINLIIDIFKVPIPSSMIPNNRLKKNKDIWNEIEKFKNNKQKFVNNLIKNKYIREIYTSEQINSFGIDDLKRIYYWSNQQINQMCQVLREFLDDEKLLILDPNCGIQQKKKK